MAANIRKSFLCALNLQLHQVRYRRPNIQRPRPGIRERRLFEAITIPLYPRLPDNDQLPVCSKIKHSNTTKPQEVADAYTQFLLRQCEKMLREHRMIVVCQSLPISARDNREVNNKLKHKNMRLAFFSNTMMRTAVSETPFSNMAPFFTGHNQYIVSTELRLSDMVKVLRRVPQLHVMGGLIDNYILSRENILRCAKLPPLDVVQGELASILNMSAAKTYSLLGSHQEKLSRSLEQYITDRQSEEAKS